MAKNTDIVKKPKGGALASWDQELAQFATDIAAKEVAPAGQFISFRGGILSIAGSPQQDNEVKVVVLDHCFENALYEGDFNPDVPQNPICFAFGREEGELEPHDKSAKPQCESCADCKWNKFGSAEKGKGKACKNIRRLALLSGDALSEENIANGEVLMAKVPVTSVKGWAHYVKALAATIKRPPFAVITRLKVIGDADDQFKVTFLCVDNIGPEFKDALLARREGTGDLMMSPYEPSVDAVEAPAKAGKGGKAGKDGKAGKAAPAAKKQRRY